jgi:glutamyl-tRNA synthetase
MTTASRTPLQPTPREVAVGRYAPSPTGRLHLGNLRTALLAEHDIRSRGGIYILRMEDTDLPRNVPGAEASIVADLQWLGVTFDEGPHLNPSGPAGPYRQSERSHIYEAALLQLAAAGLIYPCTCSRKDLQSGASAPHGPDGPIYPGTCGKLSQTLDVDTILTQARTCPGTTLPASLRFRASAMTSFQVHDEIHGSRLIHPAEEIGDFVVLRRDGLWAYQFVCAVDDALMGVTRVVRGEDLLTSVPRQAAVVRQLGFTPPIYCHIPLMTDAGGQRLSKRSGADSLDTFRAHGVSPADFRHQLLSRI